MIIKEILEGESKHVEFKESLPDKSIKYMKTVVAFADGQGGKIIFGIQDGTCKVIGIPNEIVFKTMDAITNAISDSCKPVIIPDISLQEIDGKTLIVAEIAPGMLSRDMTIERMKDGYSKIRNRGIASAFSYMKIIEGWGSGIPRMFEECKEYGLREPELIDAGGDFRINLYRNNEIRTAIAPKSARLLSEQHSIVYKYIAEYGQITSETVESLRHIKQRRARAILSEMVKRDIIKKVGSAQNTRYVLND